jgi:hypothetical protein
MTVPADFIDHTPWCVDHHPADGCRVVIGRSGHIEVRLGLDDDGDPQVQVEHTELGELLSLDLATTREVVAYLGSACGRATRRRRWVESVSGGGWVSRSS